MDWQALISKVASAVDLDFLAICGVLLVIMWVLWCLDREEKTPFRIVNFFKTNGHEDIAKLIMLFMSVVIAWSMIIEVKRDQLELYELMAYMAYALGAPVFYSLLKVVTAVFGKPEIVNKMIETQAAPAPTKPEGQ